MEQEDVNRLLRQCPLKVRTNDGQVYHVEKPEFITVADYTVSILFDDGGTKRHTVIALMNITSIEPQGELAEN